MKMNERIGAWIRWFLVVILLLAKCFVFDILVAQPEPAEWLTSNFLAVGAAAAVWALFSTFSRHRYPVFIVLGLADVWMIANILFYRSYRLFLTWYQFSLAGNLSGFESSLMPYFSLSLLWFPALTLPALICFLFPSERFNWSDTVCVLLLGVLLSLTGAYSRWKQELPKEDNEPFSTKWLNPCNLPKSISAPIWESERQTAQYIRYHSILAYPLFIVSDAIRAHMPKNAVEWSQEEQEELSRLITPVVPQKPVQGNLLIVLLESFESWLLDSYDAQGQPVCPELKRYIASHDVLYVYDVETQIQYGMSGDGQMIVNTGLYPVKEGVACVDYCYNVYPNLAHFYPNSIMVNPCKNVWNKRIISAAYGYTDIWEPETNDMFAWNDSVVTDKVIACFETMPSPCCVMGITISGHMPFTAHRDAISVSDTMPELFRHYLQTAHFTDRHIGRLLAWTDTASVMRDATIVITGDHRIFHAWLNDEVREYGLLANLPFGTRYGGCPFILSGPRVSKQTVKNGLQVDVFTTTLHAIGQEQYYWKGAGHNLMDEPNISDGEGQIRQQICDKLIQSNYFATLEH